MNLTDEQILEVRDQFQDQARFEATQLHRLFLFFYTIQAALLAAVSLGNLPSEEKISVAVLGVVVVGLGLLIFNKQIAWRQKYILKVKNLENDLDLKSEFRFFDPHDPGKGVWRTMFIIQYCFGLIFAASAGFHLQALFGLLK